VRAVAVVTAAGSAERFGGKKLLTPIDGEPLLDHTIRRAELERDVNTLLDPRVRPVENPDPSRGMFSSIREGVAQAQGDAILVMPGDMPFVSPDTVRAVIAAFERKPAIVSPRYRGKRGHPVALPISLRDEIRAADAHATLHEVVHAHTDMRIDVDVDDPGINRDVDRPEDLPTS
jgi:molybdenum cofactor cytidylyltransferase